MSDRIIEIEGEGIFTFPADATDEEIMEALGQPQQGQPQTQPKAPEQKEEPGKEPVQEQVPDSELGLIPSLNALDGFETAINNADQSIDKLINGLGELDKNKFVYSSDHYEKERVRLGNLLKLGVEEREKNSKALNDILKTVIPTEEELNKVAELAKAHNAANPRDLKTPQDIALDDPALRGKLFDRAGDGFDDVRKDREMASAIFNAYLEKARLNPNPKAYELATRVPFIGGVVSAVNSFSKKGDAKSLEMSPPKGFHKDKNLYWTGEHLDYEHALASMASWVAAMEAEHGKNWFESGGWKAWDAAMEGRVADVQKQGRLAGMGFLGQKTWDLITMAPGFAVEFMVTGGTSVAARKVVDKSAAATLRRQANRAAARSLGPLMAKATRLGVTKSYQLGRFATSTGVQTLANPQLILRNLGMEAEQDIHLEVNDAGNMVWRTEDMEMGLDLTRAYAHSLSEIGSERLGEVFAKTKAWRAVSNAFHDAKKITPGIKPSRLDELARKAGYQGPVLEMMEERANDISTYLYDIYSGKEEFTRESLDRRVAKAYTDGQIFAELVAFTLFGTGMKMGQTAMSQIQFEDSKRAIGEALLGQDRAKWNAEEAAGIIQKSPHLQDLKSHNGRVLLFQDINDPKGEKVVAVKAGESAEETTSAAIQAGVQNPDLRLRGVYHMKAGVPSEVFTATWNQSDGQKQHTFNSVEDAQAHAKALVEVGNEEAAKSIMDQAYLSMQPPSEIDALDMNDSGVINRVRLGKSRIRLADVQKIVGGQVTETDLGYRVQLSYGNLDINFQQDKITAENVGEVLASALGLNLVTQEQVDAAVTIEQKLELAEREKLEIAGGVFPELDLNGVKVPGNFLMKLDLNADSATFRHEAMHFFKAAGVINEKQWNSITDRVAPKEKEQLRKAKEDQAPEGVIDQLENKIEEKVAGIIEHRTDTRLPGESRLVDEVIKLLDKLRNLTKHINSRSLWRGIESGQFAGVAPKKGSREDRLESLESDISLSYSVQKVTDEAFLDKLSRFSSKDLDKAFVSRGMDGERVAVRLNVDAKLRSGKQALKDRGISTAGIKKYGHLNAALKALDSEVADEIRAELFEANSVQELKSQNQFGAFLGKVLSYDSEIELDNVTFGVDQSAWARAVKNDQKNVHAGVIGTVNANRRPNRRNKQRIFFIPHVANLFFDSNGRAVKGAAKASMIGGQLYASGLEYFKEGEAPIPKDKKLRKLTPKHSIQKAPEGFRDMDHWNSTLKELDTLGNQLTPGAKENLSVPDDPQGALQTLIDSTDVPEVKEAAKTLQKIFEGQPVEKRTKVQSFDEKHEKFVGVYRFFEDEVKLVKGGHTDLVLMHELVHAASSRVLDQYTSNLRKGFDASRRTGTNYIKRLKELRDQIVSGVRSVPPKPTKLKPDLPLPKPRPGAHTRPPVPKEKITPSDKDLLVARIIDAYIEAVDKMGPIELVGHELKNTPTISVIKREDDAHHRMVISNPGKPGAYDLVKKRHDLFRKIVGKAGLGRGDYFTDMGSFFLTENAVKYLQQKGEEGALKGFEKANHHTEIFRFDHTERKRKKGLANTRIVTEEIGKRYYGFQNLSEFLAEAASNPAFMMQLAQIDLGEATEIKGWMTPGAKLRDRTAKSIRGLMASNFPIDLPPTPPGPGFAHPLPPPSGYKPEHILKAERTLKKIEGRHTMLDEVAHIIADFHETKKPGDKYHTHPARYPVYSVQANAEYMEAAESGNLEKAQGMVDQAAKAAGYTDFLYHGTSKKGQRSILFDGIDQMKSEKGYFGRGLYMAKDEGLAKSNYADFSGEGVDGGAVLKLAVEESANILDLSNPKDWETYRGTTYRGRPVADLISLDNYHEIMVSAGIDGVTDLGSFGGTVVYNPEVLKSADPITRDDAGNIIPLAERFQPSSDDIRYSVQGGFEGEMTVANIPAQSQFGQMYSRVAEAIREMPLKKATFSKWMGRLKKLSEGTPKVYRLPANFPAGERAFAQEELEELGLDKEQSKLGLGKEAIEELGIDTLFSPGQELTKEEVLERLESIEVPEINFTISGDWALMGTKYEGMSIREIQDAQDKLIDDYLLKNAPVLALREAIYGKDNSLQNRESLVIASHYGLEDGVRKPVYQVAAQFGISADRARTILNKARVKVRNSPELRELYYGEAKNQEEVRFISSLLEEIGSQQYRDINLPGAQDNPELGYGMLTWQTPGTDFEQPHKLKKDTVAHARFNYNEEQLDLIESQSDLHQTGFRQGYKESNSIEKWKNTKWIKQPDPEGYGLKEAQQEFDRLVRAYEAAEEHSVGYSPEQIELERFDYRVELYASEELLADETPVFIRGEVRVKKTMEGAEGKKDSYVLRKIYSFDAPGDHGINYMDYRSAEEAIEAWREERLYEIFSPDLLPNKVSHVNNWNELNFRAVVQAAALQGKKYVAFPSHWTQVAMIEGHSYHPSQEPGAVGVVRSEGFMPQNRNEPPKNRKTMYDRMVFGTLNEAKRMAKKYGTKIVKREALGGRHLPSNDDIINYFSGSGRRANEFYHIIDANSEHFHDLAVAMHQADPEAGVWKYIVDTQGDGDVAGAYDTVMRQEFGFANSDRVMDIDVLTEIIEANDLLSLKHPDGGTVADFFTKDKRFGGRYGKPIIFNALEVSPRMAGPMARYSVQKAITPVMERIDPITKESIVDSPVAGKINENINKLDNLFKKFPNPLEDESTWRNFYAHVSGANWVVKPPYKAIDYASGRQDPADILGGMSKSQIENRLSGAKNGQLIKKAYESGKATPADTAMFFLWSILSRQKAVFPQETAFMQAVNEGAHKWIDKAAKGKFNKKELDKYLKWVQEALPEKTPGRAALDNLNSFGRNFLTIMGQTIKKDDPVTPEYAGKTRLAAWHDIMSNKKLTGRQKRRKMVAVAYGSGKGIGVGLKVISFTLLVTGNTDVFILDRVQVRHLWDAEARKDEFGGSSNVYTPAEYTGLAPMVDGLRGLAIYEALESGLEKSVKAAYEKLGRGKTFNMGGFHWDSWVASSLQEVDHGTVEYIIKKLTGTRQPMNYIGVREGRYNRWDRGIWYISAPGGTERMIQDSTGHWFLLPAEAYEGYINELKDGASKKTYEGKRVLPLGTKISTLKQSWTESEGYDQDAHDQVIATHGARLNSRQSDRLSSAFRSLRGQYSVQVTPESQARINNIEAAGAYRSPDPEVAPAYGSSYVSDFQKRHLARASQKLIYFAGSKVGQEKGVLQIEEAYAAAAVRKSQAELTRQLTDAAYKSQPGMKLPQWMQVGKWASRLRDFMGISLPLAAHLNATNRDNQGNFIFADFEMRAGLMSEKDFRQGKHQIGDKILVLNNLTKENDELVVGAFISTPDGRSGYQLLRTMTADRQAEIYNHFKREYSDLIWAVDMYIDPALRGTRNVVNGVEIPAFNRFSIEEMMAESDDGFQALAGYTPDVVATRSLIGGILGLFNPGAGSRSPGRKYKTGKGRESGNVQDLFSGHSIRAFQMLQEKHRQRFRDAVLKYAAKPLAEGESPTNLPEGWVMLDTGMNDLIQRVKKFRQFIEDETTEGTDFYKKFLGELYAKRGRQLKIRREAVEVLMQQYIRIQFNNRLYNMGAWLIRNSKGLLLAHPGTMVVNAATNDLFTMETAFQELLKGITLLPVNPSEGEVSLRMARELFVGNFMHRFPSLRKMAGIETHYDQVVEEAIPEEVFASSVSLQDLDVKYEVSASQYLREGELGAAALQLLQYGNIDVRAKQRMTYAFLKAHAVQAAKDQGLKDQAMRDFVDRFMKNPPRDLIAKAADAANLEFLNYADSPAWLQWFSATPYTAVIMPFPRFGYHFMAKQITKAAAVKDVIGKVPAEKRADAFGKLMAFSMFGLGGTGLILDMLLRDDDDEEDEARERIGTNYVKYTDPVTGEPRTKQIDREMITTARVNISWYARQMGLGTEGEDDFWLRVRNYPMIAMGGNLILAESDARKHGAWEGAKTYIRNTADLSKDFFSVGAGVKVPTKIWAEINSEPGSQKKAPAFDPYATNVPLGFYLVEQTASTLVPGTRQLNDLSVLIEPARPKKTESKTLEYKPGPWEAVRANHVGAVLSRWAEKEGLIEPMPRQGSVVTMAITGQPGDSLERRIQRIEGLSKLEGPEANIFLDPRSYRPRLATISEQSIPERTRSLELLRIMGLNLKPVNRGAYEEQIKPNPQLPSSGY